MKVKITLKHDNRVAAIKELRKLTGMGLKEAIDMIPASASWGYSFEVEVSEFPKKPYQYLQFEITKIVNSRKQELTDELKSLICKAVWDNEIVLAQDLVIALDRANTR